MILKKPCPPFIRKTTILRVDTAVLAAAEKHAESLRPLVGRRVHVGELIEDALIPYLGLKIDQREASAVRNVS